MTILEQAIEALEDGVLYGPQSIVTRCGKALAALEACEVVEGTAWIFGQPTNVDDRDAILLIPASEEPTT